MKRFHNSTHSWAVYGIAWASLAGIGVAPSASQTSSSSARVQQAAPVFLNKTLQPGNCAAFAGGGSLCNVGNKDISFQEDNEGKLVVVELGANGEASYTGNLASFFVKGALAAKFSLQGDGNAVSFDLGVVSGDGGSFSFGGNGNQIDNVFSPAMPKGNTSVVIWDNLGSGNVYNNHGENGNTVVILDGLLVLLTVEIQEAN